MGYSFFFNIAPLQQTPKQSLNLRGGESPRIVFQNDYLPLYIVTISCATHYLTITVLENKIIRNSVWFSCTLYLKLIAVRCYPLLVCYDCDKQLVQMSTGGFFPVEEKV